MRNLKIITLFLSIAILLSNGVSSQSHDLSQALWIREYEDVDGSITIVDLDRDGNKEIIALITDDYGRNPRLICFNSKGKTQWRFHFAGDTGFGDAYSVADINRDGKLEIIFTARYGVLCISHRGNLLWKNDDYDDIEHSLPAIGNLEGDEKLEIVIQPENRNPYVLNYRGKVIRELNVSTAGYETYSSPNIIDLDQDGSLDIIVLPKDEVLYVFESNGTVKWSYSLLDAWYNDEPTTISFADVDNDGNLELFVNTLRQFVYCFNHNGSLRWVYDTGSYSNLTHSYHYLVHHPTFVDFNDDGLMEIIIALIGDYPSKIVCLNNKGFQEWNKSISGDPGSSPIALADVDGDEDVEMLIGTTSGIVIYDENGTNEQVLDIGNCWYSDYSISDINDDGIVEIVTSNSDGNLICIQYPGAQPSQSSWWGISGDYKNHGHIDSDGDYLSDLGEKLLGTDKFDPDSDNDTMIDSWEDEYGLNPLADDSEEDPDSDGMKNSIEYKKGLNPQRWDNWAVLYGGYLLPVWLGITVLAIFVEKKYKALRGLLGKLRNSDKISKLITRRKKSTGNRNNKLGND